MALFTVLVLLNVLCASYAINCYYCAGVTQPEDCGEMVKCREEEDCFSDRVIGDFGNVFYNSGCRQKHVCKLIAESKAKRNQLPVCEECCEKDACNLNLCKEARNLTHTQCYACTGIDTPYDCHTKTQCLQDEMCITEEYVDPVTYKKKYKMGCEKESRCKLLNQLGKKRETTTCIECCNQGGCNRHLCYEGPNCNQLSDQFLDMPNHAIAGHNMASYPHVDYSECKQRCLNFVPTCRSFDYELGGSHYCLLSNVTRHDVPDFFESQKIYGYSERLTVCEV